jgi:3-methyl-2-oxobutanoate hydroxymethyltransferase
VVRGDRRELVVADMPFLTYRIDLSETLRNAGRLVQDAGVAAVKLEGGRSSVEATAALTAAGIPVMGHLGLTPQSVHQTGGFRAQAGTPEDAERLIEDALALESAGAFAVVLETIPAELAGRVTTSLAVPTIGIGAGGECDGQVLVSYDMLGLFQEFVPSFVKQYAKLGDQVVAAARLYADEVRGGAFPGTPQGAAPGGRKRG